jgi:hypothetical protein
MFAHDNNFPFPPKVARDIAKNIAFFGKKIVYINIPAFINVKLTFQGLV